MGGEMKHHESILQSSCVAWLRSKGIVFISNPYANIKLNIQAATRMKQQGYQKGTPDILILEPRGIFHGLAVELKIYDNSPTFEQAMFLCELGKRCYKVLVTPKGSDYAQALQWFRDAVTEYLNENAKEPGSSYSGGELKKPSPGSGYSGFHAAKDNLGKP